MSKARELLAAFAEYCFAAIFPQKVKEHHRVSGIDFSQSIALLVISLIQFKYVDVERG